MKRLLAMIATLLIALGCSTESDTNTSNNGNSDDTTTSTTNEVTVTLNISFPSDMESISKSTAVSPRATAYIFDGNTNESLGVYRSNISISDTSTSATFTLPYQFTQGSYSIALWVDYSSNGTEDLFYSTTDSNGVVYTLTPSESYDIDARDCFCTYQEVNVSTANLTLSLNLERPVAKYSLVANDVERYNSLLGENSLPELSELKCTLQFGSMAYYPTAYNIKTASVADAKSSHSISYTITNIGSSTATLLTDYIFVNSTSTLSSKVTIESNTTEVTTISSYDIAVEKGKYSIFSSNFLTLYQNSSGGVTLEEEWVDFNYDIGNYWSE